MWVPTVVSFYVLNGLNPWALWASAVWGHLQGFVSSTVSLFKPDIAKAARDFMSCRVWNKNRLYLAENPCHESTDGLEQGRVWSWFYKSSRRFLGEERSSEVSVEAGRCSMEGIANVDECCWGSDDNSAILDEEYKVDVHDAFSDVELGMIEEAPVSQQEQKSSLAERRSSNVSSHSEGYH